MDKDAALEHIRNTAMDKDEVLQNISSASRYKDASLMSIGKAGMDCSKTLIGRDHASKFGKAGGEMLAEKRNYGG